AVGDRLIGALVGHGRSRYGAGRYAGMDRAEVNAGEGDYDVSVVPAIGVGLRIAAAANNGRGLVDVDAADGCRRSRVAGVVDAVAAAREGLTRAFTANGATGDVVSRDPGLGRASLGAGEGGCYVAIVPAVGVRPGAPAAADNRRGLVDVDAAHRRRGGS